MNSHPKFPLRAEDLQLGLRVVRVVGGTEDGRSRNVRIIELHVGITSCTPRGGDDILVHGLSDSNRAVVGHVVVVEACCTNQVAAPTHADATTKTMLA